MLDNTDCNDLDATISPAAVESCEGEGEVQIDNDCDGLINEGADSMGLLSDSSTFYADVDGDGYRRSQHNLDSVRHYHWIRHQLR